MCIILSSNIEIASYLNAISSLTRISMVRENVYFEFGPGDIVNSKGRPARAVVS